PRSGGPAEAGANGIEEGDRERAHFERESLADGEIGRARRGRGEEEDHGPGDGLSGRRENADREQIARDREQYSGERVRQSDHRAAADGVEQAAEQDRAEP